LRGGQWRQAGGEAIVLAGNEAEDRCVAVDQRFVEVEQDGFVQIGLLRARAGAT
jgi:hypothetical protein